MRGLFCIHAYLFFLVTSLYSLTSTFATNSHSRDVLIEKFERIYNQLPNEDGSKLSITLRLADLLSEKARALAFSDLEQNCENCGVGIAERKRAIFLYNEALPKLEVSKRAKVLTQLGHLYEMNGEVEKSEQLYTEIIKNEKDEILKAEAKLSLAELYFKRRDFNLALVYYIDVAKLEGFGRQPLASYRIAWSYFNMGDYRAATEQMELILRTPKLLTKSEKGVSTVDEQYKAEVSKDFSTFLAKSGVKPDDVSKVYNLSPESARLSNLEYLANELEGLGQTDSAIAAFKFISDKTKDSKSRAEFALRLAHLYRLKSMYKDSLAFYEKSLVYTRDFSCQGDGCNDHFSRLRKYVLDWHGEEKENPSLFLLEAYQQHQQFYPRQVDMIFWKIEAIKKSKQSNLNQIVYAELNSLLPLYLSNKQEKGVNNQDKIPSLDELLLLRIEEAEKIGSFEFKRASYEDYLKYSQEKKHLLKVEYQLAYLFHSEKMFRESSDRFYSLVNKNYSATENSLVVQSADLALSGLAALKEEKKMTDWALEFAKWMPVKRTEFEEIARKSILNQTEKLSSDFQDQNIAWNQLLKMKLDGASPDTQVLYYKNKLILAEKLYKFDEARMAAGSLLELKNLSEKDRQWALSRKAWLAELALDFKTALHTTQKLELEPYRPVDKDLKLAILAELSGEDYRDHYQKFLKQAETPEQKLAAALKVVESSQNQLGELKKHKKYFDSFPEAYAFKYLEILSAERKDGEIFSKRALAELAVDKKTAGTPSYTLMWRHNFVYEVEELAKSIQLHQIDSKSDKSLNTSLLKRVKLLEGLEQKLKEAIKMMDSVAQLSVVYHLSRESQRLYQEILSLPTPEGLSEDEQIQYMQLLSQQASPYRIQSEELAKKEEEFWLSEGLVDKFEQLLQEAQGPAKLILTESVSYLIGKAPDSIRPSFDKLILPSTGSEALPSIAELERAKALVRQNPLKIESLNSLIEIEKRFKNENMINYLIGRKQQIETLLGGNYE